MPLNHIWLDEDFARGPRVDLMPVIAVVALVLLIAFLVWGIHQ